MHAKCMTDTLGHMLQDIKNNYPNKYPAAMRTVKSWKNYSFIGFTPTMREEIDKAWIEPNTWNDGKRAAMADVPLLEVFIKQYEEDKRTEQRYSNAMVWHINTINMLYGQMFQSSFTSFEEFLYGDATEDTFVFGFEYLLEMDKNKNR